jgi:anti-sigma B factor antagonist
MNLSVKQVDQVQIVNIDGDIDGKTAPEAQEKIIELIQPGSKILLDLSGVDFMSSAGLRMLLVTYRQITSNNGQVVLVGVSEEITDIMSATGFLRFFETFDSVPSGLASLS